METAVTRDKGDSAVAPGPEGSSSVPTALLLNDTSFWYHWGCSCTSLTIHEHLRSCGYGVHSLPINTIHELTEVPVAIDGFDDDQTYARFSAQNPNIIDTIGRCNLLVINGEGTLHGVSPAVLAILYLAYITKKRIGRPVHFINHSCYPDHTTASLDTPVYKLYRKVYEQLDFVAVREELSAGLLEEMGIRVTRAFDCLPLFIRNHYPPREKKDERHIVIAGGVAWGKEVTSSMGTLIERMSRDGYNVRLLVGANAYPAADDWAFMRLLRKYIGKEVELINATSEMEWLDTIHAATLLVSGRFHHSIAAACLETPFMVTESNTPKIAGIMKMMRLDTQISLRDVMVHETLLKHVKRLLDTPSLGIVAASLRAALCELGLNNFLGLRTQKG